MTAARRRSIITLTVVVGMLVVGGCASGPPRVETTFLRSVDLIDMTERMAESFTRAAPVTSRTTASPPWYVSFERLANHTNELIPEREKWLYIARLRALLARSDVGAVRNIHWIMPAERWRLVSDELGVSEEPYGLRQDPTHILTAEFNALTTSSGHARTDAYLCSFQLIDVMSGAITWEDAWEMKRGVTGLVYD